MPRNVTIRRRSLVAGVVSLLGATLVGAAVLSAAAPAQAAPPVERAATTTPSTSSTGCLTITRPPATTPSWTPGQVVSSWDGEDGATSPWQAPAGITLTNTTAAAASGTHSLRVDGVTVTSPVTFPANAAHNGWFTVTAKVRLAPRADGTTGAPVVVALRPHPTDPTYGVAGTALVGADGWVTVTASYRPERFLQSPPACFGGPDYYLAAPPIELSRLPLCGEPPSDAGVPLYVDDLQITTADGYGYGSGILSPTTTPAPIGPSSQPCGSGTTTTPPPAAQCTVSHHLETQWGTGYVATVTVRNDSTAALPLWKLQWLFPGAQKVVDLWGAQTWSQSGRTVTLSSWPWQSLQPGGTATLGFIGGGTAAAAPLAATLQGKPCTVTAS